MFCPRAFLLVVVAVASWGVPGAQAQGVGTVVVTTPGTIAASGASVLGGGSDGNWTFTGNTQVSLDDNDISNTLELTNFGVTFPALQDLAVTGIEISITRGATNAGRFDDYCAGLLGTFAAGTPNTSPTSCAASGADGTIPFSPAAKLYGGSSDLWGLGSISPGDVNVTSFGVSYRATKSAAAGNVGIVTYVSIQVTIHYSYTIVTTGTTGDPTTAVPDPTTGAPAPPASTTGAVTATGAGTTTGVATTTAVASGASSTTTTTTSGSQNTTTSSSSGSGAGTTGESGAAVTSDAAGSPFPIFIIFIIIGVVVLACVVVVVVVLVRRNGGEEGGSKKADASASASEEAQNMSSANEETSEDDVVVYANLSNVLENASSSSSDDSSGDIIYDA